MKRSVKLVSFLSVGAATLLAAAPAFAQYEYTYETTGDFPAWLWGIYCCSSLFGLLFTAFWIWMLIDAFMRQEYEFPNSSGNSKLIWILLLFFVSISVVFYYFMVFRKVKRGQAPPPGGYGGGYQPPMAPPQAPPPPPPPMG